MPERPTGRKRGERGREEQESVKYGWRESEDDRENECEKEWQRKR